MLYAIGIIIVVLVLWLVNFFSEKLAKFFADLIGLLCCIAVCYAINVGIVTNWKQVIALSIIAGLLGGLIALPLLPFYRKTNSE